MPIGGIESMRLFPAPALSQVCIANGHRCERGWGWDCQDLTIRKVFTMLGCPERLELEYSWPVAKTKKPAQPSAPMVTPTVLTPRPEPMDWVATQPMIGSTTAPTNGMSSVRH